MQVCHVTLYLVFPVGMPFPALCPEAVLLHSD